MSSVVEYSLCIYWGVRPESREIVADNLTVFLSKLSALNDSFSFWYPVGKRKKNKIPLPVPFDVSSIALMLTTSKTDFGEFPVPDLGFRFFVWAGWKPKFGAHISANCGAYTKFVVNSVIITFTGPEFPSMKLMRDIYGLMREIFQPEAGAMRVYERFILDGEEEKYRGRIIDSFGKIDKNGEVIFS